MNKKKKMLQAILILVVMVIGVYMLWENQWGTPPALSGLAFLLTGLAMWVPYCPVAHKMFGDKHADSAGGGMPGGPGTGGGM